VRFTTVAAMVNELLEARDDYGLSKVVSRWARVDLMVADELGYVTLPPSGAEMLFQVLAQRAETGSVIVTTNLPFSEWTTVFTDPRLCKAVVERLTYRSHIVETGTESYRFKHSLARTKEGRKTRHQALTTADADRYSEWVSLPLTASASRVMHRAPTLGRRRWRQWARIIVSTVAASIFNSSP